MQVAPEGTQGAMQVTSGFAGYSRIERYMRFERGMRMERQGQVMEAETSTIFLLKDRDEPENVELRGNSRITGAAGTSSLQAMRAQDINLHYAAGRPHARARAPGRPERHPAGAPGRLAGPADAGADHRRGARGGRGGHAIDGQGPDARDAARITRQSAAGHHRTVSGRNGRGRPRADGDDL